MITILGWLICAWMGSIATIVTMVQAVATARGMGRQRKWGAATEAAAG